MKKEAHSASLISLISLAATSLLVQTCYAFNGNEHKEIADTALMTAIEMNNIECTRSENEICNLLPTRKEGISYGKITESFDYAISPSIILSHRVENISYPIEMKQLNHEVLDKISETDGNYFRASHNNEAHFQGQLMFEMQDWHKKALAEARRGNLFGALTINSISDHFLHDFFAPGHITTARYNSHDAFALAMHDSSNNLGARFNIENISDLKPILTFIEKN